MKPKTKATTIDEYLAEATPERREILDKVDAAICAAVPNINKHFYYNMISWGLYKYKYASGREGEWPLIMLANQKNYISVYICAAEKDKGYLAENNKDRLGSVSVGKSCIRFKKLEDINLDVLAELCKKAERLVKDGNFAM